MRIADVLYKCEPGFLATLFYLQELELAMKENILSSEKWLEVITEQDKQMRMLSNCHTVEELFIHQKSIYPGLTYLRIPLSECCTPKEEASQNTTLDISSMWQI